MRPILTLIALVLSGVAPLMADSDPAPGPDPRLAFLTSLEGRWISESVSDDMHDGIFEYRVTAGGTAIEERLMAGSPAEMLTVYHMDGADLVATHYCLLGNQPHYRASRQLDDGTLAFDCDGKPSNAASHADAHIHGWTMTLEDDGRLHFQAVMLKGGEVVERPEFTLTRE